ncbi:MAG: hypothetical protein J5992_00195, partial [Oscillospiraceae bacterium]|nr:hypothetical protein [Oscillospiraceae bacterium]
MHHKAHIAIVEISAGKILLLTRYVFYNTLLPKVLAELQIVHFLGGNDAKAYAARKSGKIHFLEGGGTAVKGGALGVMSTGVGDVGFRIGIGMSRHGKSVKLAENKYLRSRTTGIQIRVEAGDVSRLHGLEAELAVSLQHKGVSLPLLEARLGVMLHIIEYLL